MSGDTVNINKNRKTNLNLRHSRSQVISLEDMIGKYSAIEPINSVELKHELK